MSVYTKPPCYNLQWSATHSSLPQSTWGSCFWTIWSYSPGLVLIGVNFDPMQEVGYKVGYMQPLTFYSLFYIHVCSELVPLEMRLIAECSGARQSGCIVSSVWNIFGAPPFCTCRYTWFPVLLNIHASNKLECTALCVRFQFFTCMCPS